jgi:hypothetical protein
MNDKNVVDFDTNVSEAAPAEEVSPVKLVAELKVRREKMVADEDKKIESACSQLKNQIDITARKYLTATGVITAYSFIRDVVGNLVDPNQHIVMAQRIAEELASMCSNLAAKFDSIDVKDLDKLCDDMYDHEFITKIGVTVEEFAQELAVMQMCQNFGPKADDIKQFKARADEEIAAVDAKIAELIEKNDLDSYDINAEYLALTKE